MHRFGRPAGPPHPLTVEDKLRNYLIGHVELGLDPTPVLAHFSEILPEDRVVAVAAETLWGPEALEPVAATPPEVNAGAAKALQDVEDKPRRVVVEHTQQQPEGRAPVVASVATRISSNPGVSSRSARTGGGPEASLHLVSCICPTYNRLPHYQHLLEEAIASFCDRTIRTRN